MTAEAGPLKVACTVKLAPPASTVWGLEVITLLIGAALIWLKFIVVAMIGFVAAPIQVVPFQVLCVAPHDMMLFRALMNGAPLRSQCTFPLRHWHH
jgi:hypothetical protein